MVQLFDDAGNSRVLRHDVANLETEGFGSRAVSVHVL
jgi:hypothetical protein